MSSTKWCLLVFSFMLLTLVIGCGDDDDSPTGSRDTSNLVWVDSVSAPTDGQVAVDINIKNSAAILGTEVPLRLSGSNYVIDSGSFVGSVFSGAVLKKCSIDVPNQVVFFMATSLSAVPAGEGLFGKLYVTLSGATVGAVIDIDSALVPVGGSVYHVVSYVKSDMGQVLPPFNPGKIVVEP